ncbi:endonuclease/exonuclease/phosphatase family protein [Seonamhaeicola marinus]|uniref:Endonuclease n=1 Tax=Seonamhaeicola marinus TaxID=1912246 RepID=A0A5D0HPG2_9FLAO|nr:endonuclease/exonuclease/phosphatase family protein [Seonamhaeicola marinus]TYA71957.1 hypothetical protein FUA24_20630 [Seonamhaeicola marinus]
MWYNDLRPDNELTSDRYSLIMLDPDNDYEREMNDEDKKRTIANILELKKGILKDIPSKTVDRNLLLASWNIKNFGKLLNRTSESLYYIAEIINAFDIVGIQEINSDITQFKKLLKLLGSNWKYTLSDVTEGSSGNDERFGFIYDSTRVTHSGLAGELVIPPEMISDNPIIEQLKRTPTFTGFESGWRKFSIVSVHLHPGDDADDKVLRKEEVKLLLDLLEEKMKDAPYEDQNLIILGDTNLYEDDTEIVDLFTDKGFVESEGLIGKFTNTSLNQIYDRIFLNVHKYFKVGTDIDGDERGGVFNLFDYVYKNTQQEIAKYHPLMLQHKGDPSTLTSHDAFESYFNSYWKRNQMSDHLPVWLEIEVDSSPSFLKSKLSKF